MIENILLIMAIVGWAIVLISLLFDDLFESIDFDAEWMSSTTVGAFLATLGTVGYGLLHFTAVELVLAGLVAVPLSFGIAIFAGWLVAQMMKLNTDATPVAAVMVGSLGTVVTPIVPPMRGEVLIRVGGQPVKLSAKADLPIGHGEAIAVVYVYSPTSVLVVPAP